MRGNNAILLRAALGQRYDTMTEGEGEVAVAVLEWAMEGKRDSYKEKLEAYWNSDRVKNTALCIKAVFSDYEAVPWESIADGCRKRELVDLRDMACYMFWKLTGVSKGIIAKELGLPKHRTTVHHGIMQCEDAIEYDRTFRHKYEALKVLVEEMLGGMSAEV